MRPIHNSLFRLSLWLLSCLLLSSLTISADDAPAQATTTASRWWEKIPVTDATSPRTLALWRFDTAETVGKNESSHKLDDGKLAGALWSAEGRFGGCIESAPGFPVEDKRHAFLVKRSPLLSPSGPFTLEMWLRPKPADIFVPELSPVLADSKYVPYRHNGFKWSLTKGQKDGTRRFALEIGLGNRSANWISNPITLSSEEWHHAAFSYDGQGTTSFWLDGVQIGQSSVPAAGGMAMAEQDLSIADRLGSNFQGFPGWIDEVRLSEGLLTFRPFQIETQSARPAFLRFTEKAAIRLNLRNLATTPLTGAKLRLALPGAGTKEISLPAIAPGESHPLELPIDATLRADEYTADVTFLLPGWGGEKEIYTATERLPYVLVRRPLPHRMPVVMWGIGGNGLTKELPRLKDIGFTHCLGLWVDMKAVWDNGAKAEINPPDIVRSSRDMLDLALANDMRIISSVSPTHWLSESEDGKPYVRINREGKPYDRPDVSGLFPRVQEFSHDVGVALGRTYGDHPAFESALLSTEQRDATQLSFHPIEIEAAKKALGSDIPAVAKIKNGVKYDELPDFPKDRVVADDDPVLAYYRWFWSDGDGWSAIHSRLNDGLHESINRKNFWTFFDPAVRVPSVHGSGGNADVLSHWTYTYPDPIRIGLCADELFAMARANGHHQRVMKMTQIIWYRSRTAPAAPAASEGLPVTQSPWLDYDAGASYITIAPMHLREALWLKLARPVSGIMYHGWGSLVPLDPPTGYTFTNPNTAPELKRLISDVVEPLGPTLLQVPDVESDVVFLESFTSQMFARRGTYGWGNSWAADLYQIATSAQLQSDVTYEENLTEERLKRAKILIMGDCDVLPKSIVTRVLAFQKAGGIVVGDGELCPAIKPDILVPRYARVGKAAEDYKVLLGLADKLKTDLSGKGYQWILASDNSKVYTRRRAVGNTDYLFAINDSREAGTYVGGHGLVMEDGVPSDTVLRLRRAKGHAYDLSAHQPIPMEGAKDGQLSLPLSLGPCEGRVIMVTERPVEKIGLNAPKEAKAGDSVPLEIAITDAEGKPIDAVVPVDLRIVDPEGAPAEPNGYYGAGNGVLKLTLDLAKNDRVGLWEIRAKEGATGREVVGWLRVKPSAK